MTIRYQPGELYAPTQGPHFGHLVGVQRVHMLSAGIDKIDVLCACGACWSFLHSTIPVPEATKET